MMYLRHVTSSTIMVGPFVGSDGVALTGLTLTQSTFMFSKNGAAFTAKNETTNGSHRVMGYYSIMVDSSDLNTAGRLLLISSAQNALPVRQEFTVLPTSVYDSLVAGSDLLQTNLVSWRGTQPNALVSNRVDASAGAIADTVITSAAWAAGGVERMANALAVDMSSISVAIAARSPVNALRTLRNRITTSGMVTVYAENDSTAVWTASIVTDAGAHPIVEADPA